MNLVSVDDVDTLDDDRRSRLEAVVGSPLEPHQQVFIMVYTPDVVPDESTRRQAVANMRRLFARADAHAERDCICDEDVDSAIDAAMKHARGNNAIRP